MALAGNDGQIKSCWEGKRTTPPLGKVVKTACGRNSWRIEERAAGNGDGTETQLPGTEQDR